MESKVLVPLLFLAITIEWTFATRAKTCLKKGRLPCSVSCQQGTAYYPDGCCACVCKKNYVRTDSVCTKALWSRWSSWSKCIKADWGGLQTKERVCKSKGRSAPGSCDGKGSIARTCSAITEKFRIRKNIKELTDEEIHDLIQAMTKFKKDTTTKGYRGIIWWHGWPGSCPWYHNIEKHSDNHCSWHHHPLFLPWHRLITVQFELGLSRYLKNKTLGIPFWDWTDHRTAIPSLVHHAQIYDPVLKKYVKNPFHSNFVRNWKGVDIYNQRYPSSSGLLMDKYILQGTVRALLSHDYYNYDEQQSKNPHDQIHDCFCVSRATLFGKEVCDFGMPTVKYAAFDPVFLLHHSQIDRLFVMRRLLEKSQGVSDWTKERVIYQYLGGMPKPSKVIKESFDWPLSPFCNQSMNTGLTTGRRNVWTMRNAYYHESLFGYKYTNYDLGDNYSWKDLQRDFKKNVMDKTYWNDDIFHTKIGVLTKKNSYSLKKSRGCVMKYSKPHWNMTIKWKH